ncbi:MAG TPA: hypothetical protein DEP05_07740 [Betaproteobacteria bacterium]|nr:hypothetical protein [Betaproteobacteria bacterium]
MEPAMNLSPPIADLLDHGVRQHQAGHLAAAEDCYRQILARQPQHIDALHLLGLVAHQAGQPAAAVDLMSQAIALAPATAIFHNNIGEAYRALGRLDSALHHYLEAQRLQPDYPEAANNQGLALIDQGSQEAAIALYQQLLQAHPDYPPALLNLGLAFQKHGDFDNAAHYYRAVLAQAPDTALAQANLAALLLEQGELDAAHAEAIKLLPAVNQATELFITPFQVFRATCDFDSAAALGDIWQRCDHLSPGQLPIVILNLLPYARDPASNQRLADLCRKWGQWTEAAADSVPLAVNDVDGKIRLGFLSSDLRRHSVAKFLLPFLRHCDRTRFEIYCYSTTPELADPVQEEIQRLSHTFATLANHSDRQIAESIARDRIALLFDLNGHTQHGRCAIFAYRPAPIQISWMGFLFTTGLSTIDYVLLDAHLQPDNPDWWNETPLTLPNAFICFGALDDQAILPGIPADRDGNITFGAMNNPYKYTAETIRTWADILRRVPGARFLFVRRQCASAVFRHNVLREFAKHGVGGERIAFADYAAAGRSHLDYYNEIDISLDTFPLAGGVTTADSLWMGCPVVSLAGENLHQRMGLSFLSQVALSDLCAADPDGYAAAAVALAADRDRLRRLRHELRPALRASSLCREADFAHDLGALLEQTVRAQRAAAHTP